MGKKISERELMRHGEHRYKRSSDLYRYLVDNMVGLRAQGYGTRNGPPWIKLVECATKDGFTRMSGQPLTIEAVRKVFARANNTLVMEERLRRTGVGAKPTPNRVSKGWTPPVATQPTMLQTQPAPFAPTPTSPARADPSQMTPAERKADLMRVIDKRSGR